MRAECGQSCATPCLEMRLILIKLLYKGFRVHINRHGGTANSVCASCAPKNSNFDAMCERVKYEKKTLAPLNR